MKAPHLLEKAQVLQELNTEMETGLSATEAGNRLATYGPNELIEKGKKSAFAILFAQVKEVMIVILLIAAVISAALHEYITRGRGCGGYHRT